MFANSPRYDLPSICQLVLRLMRAIDDEAIPVENDYPTGLWWYVGHLDRDREVARKVMNSEVQWSRRLAEMLREHRYQCHTEQRYPGQSRQRCDVVVEIPGRKPLWIEVKGAWRAKFDSGTPNASYYKYLGHAAKDLIKLERLGGSNASAIMLVWVGFDQRQLPITAADLAILQETASGWHECSRRWYIRRQIKFRVRCHVWSRALN